MPKYKKGDEKNYLSTVLAALVIIAVAVASFIYSMVKNSTENVDGIKIENVGGVIQASPTDGLAVPTTPPSIEPPTVPPPGN